MESSDTRRIDLDGLQVFDMVMREGNVTRAAERLALTQSAVSHALARLRHIHGDPLFVRAAGGVRPTPRAQQLWREVRESLQILRRAASPATFDAASARFGMSLAINDMLVHLLVPAWYARLQHEAPGLTLRLVTRTLGDTEARLAQGTLDFGVGLFSDLPEHFSRRELWMDQHVCVFRRASPVAAMPWDLEAFRSVAHIAISPDGEAFTYADSALRHVGIERRIGLVVSQFSVVPALLEQCDLMALLPRRLALAAARRHDLEVRETPFPLQPVKYELVWHERSAQSLAHMWFRDHVVEHLRWPAMK
ncbi:MAG: LysR family transcriptional regulator [Burkholderiales bacterium]|jgi:DNA-binding transcriptional LysR family regulator|nr:LysR family transcriptional regulator [Burkholderiales bacterium]